jgi:putative addiction module component (TIGR02574 family)
MSTRFEQVAADAMKLPVRDRVRLAQQLVSTLDDNQSEVEVEELWFAEAKRRLDELHTGKVESIDADEVFKSVREKLAG